MYKKRNKIYSDEIIAIWVRETKQWRKSNYIKRIKKVFTPNQTYSKTKQRIVCTLYYQY